MEEVQPVKPEVEIKPQFRLTHVGDGRIELDSGVGSPITVENVSTAVEMIGAEVVSQWMTAWTKDQSEYRQRSISIRPTTSGSSV